jgi:hypothetical protein
MARTPSQYATTFAELLNAKFELLHGRTYGVVGGNKYDKIVIERDGKPESVHAFVTKNGEVLKAAGWNAPAKHVRFTNVLEAAEKSDRHGAYLYL